MRREQYSAFARAFSSAVFLLVLPLSARSDEPQVTSEVEQVLTDRANEAYFDFSGVSHGGQTSYWLGVEASPVPRALAAQLGMEEWRGLVIDEVLPDSPAERAGLDRYDVLVSVSGKTMRTLDDLRQALQESEGKEITLEVFRSGKRETLKATPVDQLKNWKTLLLDVTPQIGDRRVILRPLAAYVLKPADLPEGVKIVITKEGKSPVEIVVTRGDQAWKIKDAIRDQLPEDLREAVSQFLRQPLAEEPSDLDLLFNAAGADPSAMRNEPEASTRRALEEIVRRLDAIEAKLNSGSKD